MKTHQSGKAILIAAVFLANWVTDSGAATVALPPKARSQSTAVAPAPSTPKVRLPGTQYTSPCGPASVATLPQGGGPTSAVGPIVGQIGNVATMGPNYVGPTPNITAVANAIGLRAKSLTTLITVRSGLGLSKPVGITIDYSSPAAQSRAAQAYDTCNGNRFLYNDPISGPVNSPGYSIWGKPRQMAIKVTLTEDRPGGQPYVYTIPLTVNLDPLFDITISPMRFTMTTDCDSVGDSEVHFLWYSPDNVKQYGEKSFDTGKGKLVTINEFAWARQEASASANLLFPTFSFYEYDPHPLSPLVYDIPKPQYKLLPGGGGYVGRHLTDSSGQGGCEADAAFDMTITLRQYQNL